MDAKPLEAAIDAAWEARDSLGPATRGAARDAVEAALSGLDSGELRVAEKIDGRWQTRQWLKKAVLLSFRLNDSAPPAFARCRARWCAAPPSSPRARC